MRVLEAEVILNLELYKSRFILICCLYIVSIQEAQYCLNYLDNYDFKTCLNWTK